MYEKEINVIECVIALLEDETDKTLVSEFENKRLSGATSLECYGITKHHSVHRFLQTLSCEKLYDNTEYLY